MQLTTPHGHRCESNSAKPGALFLVFVLVWVTGWALATGATVLEVWRYGFAAGPVLMIAVIVLATGAVLVLYPLIWVATGRRETLEIRDGELTLRRGFWPLARVFVFPPFTIEDIVVVPPESNVGAPRAVDGFWSGGAGRIQWTVSNRSYAIGTGLTADHAMEIVTQLERTVPFAAAPKGQSAAASSTFLQFGIKAVAGCMLVGIAELPLRAVTDYRATCFGVTRAEPAQPVDVRGMKPPGAVALIPIDDFPVAAAESIARHFIERFGTPVVVSAPLRSRPHFFDRNGQLNAQTVSSYLDQRRPPTERRVQIALTSSDLNFPTSGWRFAFSYRRQLTAVVSDARMQRGCLGLVTVDEPRRLERLRKMVGKNIGVLYYGLPQSGDPRSLTYADITSTQELDTMSESF